MPPSTVIPLLVALAAAAWALAWLRLPALPARLAPRLEHRAAPAVLGAVSALTAWWAWGSLRAAPVFHDETAYLLQARIFASGRWAAPSPPLPEFFEQYHVLVTPALAAKYPPGHALALAPGALMGLPGLVPVLLTGVAGALLFWLARRFAGAWTALLAWVLWIGAPANLHWRASYFSETTSSAACLAALAAFVRWRETGRRGWLLAVAAFVGWGAVTRPLTLLAFALPLGVMVLREAWRRRAWGSVAVAAAVGVAVLAVIPLWSARTTGDWRTTPLSLYTRQYMPWDRVGFGLDSTPPLRALPPDMEAFSAGFRNDHARYLPSAVPRAAARRARWVALGTMRWSGVDIPPLPLETVLLAALAACLVAGATARRQGATAVAAMVGVMFAAYLAYEHRAVWTLYYVELIPGVAYLCAVGFGRIVERVGRGRPEPGRRAARAALLAAGALLPAAVANAAIEHVGSGARQAYFRAFERRVAAAPGGRLLVFIRYGPHHSVHLSLVRNEPDPAAARVWRVYDRGADDLRLMRAAPDRVPYLFDEASGRLFRIAR
ncbi:MAG: hypothetical protein ACJ8J0_13505 [Longimicrobiaceae bacterium]